MSITLKKTEEIQIIEQNKRKRYVDLTFLIDTSGSMMGAKIDHTLEGMKIVYDSLENLSRISCIIFNDEHKTLVGLKLKTKLKWDKLTQNIKDNVRGSTALYDSILHAIDTIDWTNPYNNHRYMIIFTDGENNVHNEKFNEVKEKMAHPGISDVNFVIIGTGITENYKLVLKELCEPEHCKYLDCENSREAIIKSFTKVCKIILKKIRIIEEIYVEGNMIEGNMIEGIRDFRKLSITGGENQMKSITSGNNIKGKKKQRKMQILFTWNL